MGANSLQGWSRFLFVIGFTFSVAGLVALGPIFAIIGLASLIASVALFYRIKPLEHTEPNKKLEPVSRPAQARQAV